MSKIDEPYADNHADTTAMPQVVETDSDHHWLLDQHVDGEDVDRLKPEIIQWLQDNCTGRWRLMFRFDDPEVISDEDRRKPEVIGVAYVLRFADGNDAFAWRMRWGGPAI